MVISVLDRATFGDDTPMSLLNSLGTVNIYDRTSADELISHAKDADIIVLNKVKITREYISSAKKLRLICVFGTGYDPVDIQAAREYGVAVCNVPGYSTDSVALFTVTTALALYSHIYEYNEYVKSGEYSASGVANKLTPVFHELTGRTWGIIGCGNIGRAVARVAEALGAKVIVNKRTPVSDYTCVDINTICRDSDIITIHCPLNDESRGLINEERISLMKKHAVIVNEARGAVVNDEDIVKALKEGRIGAFGSDVYTAEPFNKSHPFNEILTMKNVLLTPHAAWGAYEARERCMKIICNNIKSFLSGGRENRVD